MWHLLPLLPPYPATLGTGLAVIAGLDGRSVSEDGRGGRPDGLTEAGPAVGLATVQVGSGGAQQSQADTALVAAFVVFLPACRCEVITRGNILSATGVISLQISINEGDKCAISLLQLTSIVSTYFKLITQLKNIMSACQSPQTRSNEMQN